MVVLEIIIIGIILLPLVGGLILRYLMRKK